MSNSNYGIIMAGGIGSRFWPLSTSEYPKQFHDILGTGKTFLQQTFQRLNRFIPANQIYVVTTASYANLTAEQLPEINRSQIILEPVGRNTAACNLYAALKIQKINPNAALLVAPSDHLILDEQTFEEIARKSLEKASNENVLITMGIQPTRPDTGYGYIQHKNEENDQFKEVKTFTEKPNKELAQQFIESGDFLWNAGIFTWSVQSIIQSFQKYLPDLYSELNDIYEDLNTENENTSVQRVYPTIQSISVDNGILEESENVFVIPSSFGWSDLGTWGSLYENFSKDENGNANKGKHNFLYNTKNCLINIKNEKAVVIDGLEDYIIVDTEKALLICPKGNDQEVKKYVNDLKFEKRDSFV